MKSVIEINTEQYRLFKELYFLCFQLIRDSQPDLLDETEQQIKEIICKIKITDESA